MTSEEPLSGTTTVIRCNDGERVHRKFQKNACFQVHCTVLPRSKKPPVSHEWKYDSVPFSEKYKIFIGKTVS